MPDLPIEADAPPPPRLWWGAILLLCLALLAPLLVIDVPPLLDYPNHLARLVVLAAHGADPVLARFYAPAWAIIPDLGIDVLGVGLLQFLPVHVAGRMLIGLAVLLPVSGCIAYSRAAFGRRSWWALGAGLVGYNQTLLLGFLNFSLGLGLALWLAAAWLAWRESRPARALAILVPGAVVLFFCHLVGLLFLFLLIGAHELGWLWRTRAWRRVPGRVAAVLAICAGPAALYAASSLHRMQGGAIYPSLATKFAQLLVPFVTVVLPLDIATSLLVAAILAVALARLQCRWNASAAIGVAVALLLYAAAPAEFKGVANVDQRLITLIGFLLFAALLPLRIPRAVGVLVACVLVTRLVVLGAVWTGARADLADLRRVIATVQPGETVLLVSVEPEESPGFWAHAPRWRVLSSGLRVDTHLPALLVIERHAWWPLLFDNDSQQPVRTRQPYAGLAERVGGILGHDVLRDPAALDLCGFDHVLLLEAAGAPDRASLGAGRLVLRADSPFAALYDVRQDVACRHEPARQGGS